MLAVAFRASFGQTKTEIAATLNANMRKLWEDHVVWTRNVIFCITDNLPGKEVAMKRLLQNQVDIGNALKPYYGEANGKKITGLLTTHINIEAEVFAAEKSGNTSVLADETKRWNANADETANYLNTLNTNWSLPDLKKYLNEHLILTNGEVTEHINKEYKADIIAYDNVHAEILKISDFLTNGIVKQFPSKFPVNGSVKK